MQLLCAALLSLVGPSANGAAFPAPVSEALLSQTTGAGLTAPTHYEFAVPIVVSVDTSGRGADLAGISNVLRNADDRSVSQARTAVFFRVELNLAPGR